jgi:Na+-driven multidrug efflux pump
MAWAIGLLSGCAAAAASYALSGRMGSVFTGDSYLAAHMKPLFQGVGAVMLVAVMSNVAIGGLDALGKQRAADWAAFVSYWPIGLGTCAALGSLLDQGAMGVVWGLLTGQSCAFLASLVMFAWHWGVHTSRSAPSYEDMPTAADL